jgi:hypothetical protein
MKVKDKSPRRAMPEALLWRTDVPWPQDQEPVLSLVSTEDIPVLLARLKKLGVPISGTGAPALEAALAHDSLLPRLADPKRGATSLALALVALHPAGMEKDHLAFELALLLDDDKRIADAGLAGLSALGVVLSVGGKRTERYRVIPQLRVPLVQLTAPWLDALERRGGAPGNGERLGIRIKTSPWHAFGLLTAYLASQPPRLRSAALATELHAKDGAKVLDALHHVMDRTLIPAMVALAVKAGLARPNGTRLTAAMESVEVLKQPQDAFWRNLLTQAFGVRSFAAILRMLREPEPGFVPESTLRRALKALHHTEQIISNHAFPTDARGNEAGARSELDALRTSPLMELGRTPEGLPTMRLDLAVARALRSTPAQEGVDTQKPDGHVGVDHEVHAGPHTPPHLLAGLGFFAEARILDTVSRFHIQPDHVANAAARGWEPHQMEAILAGISPRAVPDNLVRTLKDYGTTKGRAVFGRGLVVVFGSTQDADRALSDTVMSAALGDALAPGVYLVDPSKELEARVRLKEMGLALGEDTLLYSGGAPSLLDEAQQDDAPLASRLQAARRQGLNQALVDGTRDPVMAPKTLPAQVLAQLSGLSAASLAAPPPTGAVVPLKAKKSAQPSDEAVGTGRAGALEKARLDGRPVRLRYEPEAGGGSETMTVEILESFERAGSAMVRVKFPQNPRAPERVLRVNRVQSVEPAPRAEPG